MRHRGRLWRMVAVAGIALGPSAAGAQTGSTATPHPCDAQADATLKVCRAAYDAMSWMLPAAGVAAGGGNPGLGTAAGSHGFGDVSLTFRTTYTSVVLPSTVYDGSSDTVRADARFPILGPRVDFRLGLLSKALPVGTISADFLGSVLVFPKSATQRIRFGSDVRSVGGAALGFGYGLRIAMQPKGPMPVVSLNVARNGLPAFSYGDLSLGSSYAYTLGVSAIDVRLLVGRRFGALELTAGGGVDLLKGQYSVSYVDPADSSLVPRADSSLSAMRIQTLANASLVLGFFRLSVEGGFQVGKDEKLTTLFESNNTRSGRFFGGVGLGFKL